MRYLSLKYKYVFMIIGLSTFYNLKCDIMYSFCLVCYKINIYFCYMEFILKILS